MASKKWNFKEPTRKRAAKKLEPLTPPDLKRCQAEKPNGHSFMTLGGIPGRVRCNNRPDVVAKEKKPGKDGRKGSMSLCHSCLTVAQQQLGVDYLEIERI